MTVDLKTATPWALRAIENGFFDKAKFERLSSYSNSYVVTVEIGIWRDSEMIYVPKDDKDLIQSANKLALRFYRRKNKWGEARD